MGIKNKTCSLVVETAIELEVGEVEDEMGWLVATGLLVLLPLLSSVGELEALESGLADAEDDSEGDEAVVTSTAVSPLLAAGGGDDEWPQHSAQYSFNSLYLS